MPSPSRTASLSRFSTSAPQPSPRLYPLAPSSNVWHLPSADSMPALANSLETPPSSTLTPASTASEHSPSRRLLRAACSATSDDEHAVSVVEHGPCSPRQYEMRPAATDSDPAVASYTDSSLGACACACTGSRPAPPSPEPTPPDAATNTPARRPRSPSSDWPASRRAS